MLTSTLNHMASDSLPKTLRPLEDTCCENLHPHSNLLRVADGILQSAKRLHYADQINLLVLHHGHLFTEARAHVSSHPNLLLNWC